MFAIVFVSEASYFFKSYVNKYNFTKWDLHFGLFFSSNNYSLKGWLISIPMHTTIYKQSFQFSSQILSQGHLTIWKIQF